MLKGSRVFIAPVKRNRVTLQISTRAADGERVPRPVFMIGPEHNKLAHGNVNDTSKRAFATRIPLPSLM